VGAAGGRPPATVFGVNPRDACSRGLIAEDPRVRAVSGAVPAGWNSVERYAVLPSAGRPQLLLPRGSPAAGAAALRAFANGAPRGGRLAAAAAAVAVRAGASRAAASVSICVAEATPPGDLGELVLSHHLAGVLDRSRIDLAVRVGGTRPNSKPVMRVTDGAEAVAYVKVGSTGLTRSLVAAEADALRRLETAPPGCFSVPRLLHAGEWRGMTLTAVTPVGGGRMAPEPEPPAEATAELARGAGVERARLIDGPWWRRLRERIERVGAEPQRALADRAAAVFGEAELDHGRGHGDWTPWNMTRAGGRLVAWDWERSAMGVPVGIDAMHHCLLVLLNACHRPPGRAVAETVGRATTLLAPAGVGADAAPALMAAELLEMSVRFAEASDAGVTGLDDRFGRALSEFLDAGYHESGRS
jgi:hypothetical protein